MRDLMRDQISVLSTTQSDHSRTFVGSSVNTLEMGSTRLNFWYRKHMISPIGVGGDSIGYQSYLFYLV